MDTLHQILSYFAELLWPTRCVGCDSDGVVACTACLRSLTPSSSHRYPPLATPYLRRILVASTLTKTAEAFVYALKYRSVQALAPLLAHRMCDILALRPDTTALFGTNPLIIPVPLHATRFKERGYNQAELLAQRIATTTMMAMDITSLVRTRATHQQAKQISRSQRRDNIEGAFAVANPAALRGRDIVLVDDVCTTGATLNECARVLHDAGAQSVSAIVLAHG